MKKRPRFKPSGMEEHTDADEGQDEGKEDTRRPGSDKRHKTAELVIHEERIVAPSRRIPRGSRFKGYRDVVVQELKIQCHNTRYRLERWITPQGKSLCGELPPELAGYHFGPKLRSYILYQHHHCQVTQPLLHEQLREWGIDISTGTIDAILTSDHDAFHAEKDALLERGLGSAR
ncbi:Y4jO, partial [mine drainage metagenome]